MLIFFSILLSSFLLFQICAGLHFPRFTLVLDVGSSGVRVHLFDQVEDGGGFDFREVAEKKGSLHQMYISADDETKKKSLSGDAYTGLMQPVLHEAIGKIPAEYHATTNAYIYCTGGMRSLPAERQAEIHEYIYEESVKDALVTIHLANKDIKTISGEDEGMFAVFAANYLMRNIPETLQPSTAELVGTFEMGGSSFQIAFDVKERWRRFSLRKRRANRPLDSNDFFLHSFKNYGINEVRDRIQETITSTQENQPKKNPCIFTGYSDEKQAGDGNFEKCMELISQILSEDNKDCPSPGGPNICALQSVEQPKLRGKFYALSVFHYAVDFARKAIKSLESNTHRDKNLKNVDLSAPNPSLSDLKASSKVLCEEPYDTFSSSLDSLAPFTKIDSLYRRCLDLCFSISVFEAFGFQPNDRSIYFTDIIEDQSVKWPIGAYLKIRASLRKRIREIKDVEMTKLYQEGTSIGSMLTTALLFAVILFLLSHSNRVRGIGKGKIKYFRFIDDASD